VRRLFKSLTDTGQGAVYREVGGTNECVGTFVVAKLPPPDCEVYPTTAETTGSFPHSYGAQDEIDNVDFLSDFSILEGIEFDLDYPNMWEKIGPTSRENILSYAETCFCVGDGIALIQLVTGKPRFPNVDPIPWFYIPSSVAAAPFGVREANPDGKPLPETCCPDGETPGIRAEIVNGVLQLERTERPERDYYFRKQDSHESFQQKAGYPRWCCLPDPNEADKFVMRYLHFPLWPRIDTHDPGPDAGGLIEPLGIIPVVTDIGCTPEGVMKAYYANLIIHNGSITDVQWDVEPPRPGPLAGLDYNVAPDDPETLPVNKDYQDNDILVDGFDTPLQPGGGPPGGEGNTCDLAAALLGIATCAGECPSDVDICPGGGTSAEIVGAGSSEEAALDDAYTLAAAAMGACTEPIYLCFVVELAAGTYEATVKYCCE
jgi:hypothetical protein